jgi:hypothetical protein
MYFSPFGRTVLAVVCVWIMGAGAAVAQELKVTLVDVKFAKREQPRSNDEGRAEIRDYEEPWWAAELKFETRGRLAKEITVKFYIECYDSLAAAPDQEACTLVAQQQFINIPEGSHVATVFLHPGAALRYGGSKGSRDFSKNSVHVEVTADGQDAGFLNYEQGSKGEWYKEGQAVEGVLLPAEKSPWWPYSNKLYNQIKAAR